MDNYIDPRKQLIDAAQAILEEYDFEIDESLRKALCAALFRNRWTNDAASHKALCVRFAAAKTAEMQKFIDILAQRHGAERASVFSSKVWASPEEDGRISCRGEALPPHPDLLATYANGWSLGGHIDPYDALHYCNVHENNITRDFDLKRLTDPLHACAQWQVIFKTKEGLDYCRETRSTMDTITEVELFAVQQIKNNDLGGAVIQYW